ncbi:MAG: UvrD-helicase domain-containing protein [Polyangiaceae bacterium]|nr:UvrD-helicase domain-containing protein [Polyangiaceae bacterium]
MKEFDILQVPLSGTQLIEASAGTGKTYTITSLVLRFILERRLALEEIVAVTFTNAATAELKERIGDRLSTAIDELESAQEEFSDPVLRALVKPEKREDSLRQLRRSLRHLDRAAVFTIHGFCSRMLSDFAMELGLDEGATLVGKQDVLIGDIVADYMSARVSRLSSQALSCIKFENLPEQLQGVAQAVLGNFRIPLLGCELSVGEAEKRLEECVKKAAMAVIAAQQALDEDADGWIDAFLELPTLKKSIFRRNLLKSSVEKIRKLCVRQNFSEQEEIKQVSWERLEGALDPEIFLKLQDDPRSFETWKRFADLMESTFALQNAKTDFSSSLSYEFAQLVDERVESALSERSQRSYDTLLTDLYLALQGDAEAVVEKIQGRYRVALIDEFQDTDAIQYDVFRRLFAQGPGALFLIGDPKQAIYSFRGADIYAYLRAAEASQESKWSLGTSWRSSPSLVRALNLLFESMNEPFGLSEIGYQSIAARPGGSDQLFEAGAPLPGIEVLDFPAKISAEQKAQNCAYEVARKLASSVSLAGRPLRPEDLAILCRNWRQLEQIKTALADLQIPAIVHGGDSVYRSEEAQEMLLALRYLIAPQGNRLFSQLLSTRLIGQTAIDLALTLNDQEEFHQWLERLQRAAGLWREDGIGLALSYLFRVTQTAERLITQEHGERRMTNYRHVLELLEAKEREEQMTPDALLNYLEHAIVGLSEEDDEADTAQVRLESDRKAITLMTVHKSKGLEFPLVFLPFLSGGTRRKTTPIVFHDTANHEERILSLGPEHSDAAQDAYQREEREESLRLAYVALTRAKHQVVILQEPGTVSPLGYFFQESGRTESFSDYLSRGPVKSSKSSNSPSAKGQSEERRAHLRVLASSSGGSFSLRCAEEEEAFALTKEQARDAAQRQPTRQVEREGGSGELVLSLEEAKDQDDATKELLEPTQVLLPERIESMSSFSGMTRGAHGVSLLSESGKDYDQFVSALPAGRTEGESLSFFSSFPRGAGPGDALHQALEKMPFAEGSAEQRASVVAEQLLERGFSADQVKVAQQGLEACLHADLCLSEEPQALVDLASGQRLAEMEFHLPVGLVNDEPLTAQLLASALRDGIEIFEGPPGFSGAPGASGPSSEALLKMHQALDRYPHSVGELGFEGWRGFLRGFIDLIFEHRGRFYVLDYKSNDLGEHLNDYHWAAMADSMSEHHYFLQAALYSLALHRYLAWRLPDYSYQRYFGGVRYAFLRGMAPGNPAQGVFAFRLTEECIQKLDRLFSRNQSIQQEGRS